ncbi:hypothetical protein BFG51_07300 [Dietzia alimentaria]|nr:hypothetical protein BFG51_07300 [Dietzia alimentaria]
MARWASHWTGAASCSQQIETRFDRPRGVESTRPALRRAATWWLTSAWLSPVASWSCVFVFSPSVRDKTIVKRFSSANAARVGTR